MERKIEFDDPANRYSHVAKVHYWYEDEGDERPDYRLHAEIEEVTVCEEDGETEREVAVEPWMKPLVTRLLENELDMELRP